jgi:hypothetical protein
VITTVFSTQSWRNGRLERLLLLACALLLGVLAGRPVLADTPIDLAPITLRAESDGVFLTTTVQFDLPGIVDDALRKGIPMHFVAEANVTRDRWYWYDRKVASASRYMRLAYQPLTRRWRLNVASAPLTNVGLGLSLAQSFDSLPEALGALQRISRWRIADAADMEADGTYNVEFRFRLDVSQLPRPFQIGVAGQADWVIATSRTQPIQLEPAR